MRVCAAVGRVRGGAPGALVDEGDTVTNRGAVLGALFDLVKAKRPAGLVVPEPLRSQAIDELSRLVEDARNARPLAMDRLAAGAGACLAALQSGATLAPHAVMTIRAEIGDVIRRARELSGGAS